MLVQIHLTWIERVDRNCLHRARVAEQFEKWVKAARAQLPDYCSLVATTAHQFLATWHPRHVHHGVLMYVVDAAC